MKTIVTITLSLLSISNTMAQNISAKFPYQSKYLEVKGSKMHYIEEYVDEENPNQLTFLFLHGNPTSSYLWRNIIPYVKGKGKAVAPDLIGMGKSDKPDIDYTFQDHISYLDAFIEQKQLKNIVLVIHDWGSGLGFNYAATHEDNIRGIVFMEAMTQAPRWEDGNFIERILFKRLRDDKKGHKMAAEKNFFVNMFLFKVGTKRKLTKEEKAYYLAPYPTVASRKPLAVWPKELPFSGTPERNYTIFEAYATWLKSTEIPKLLLYAKPGVIIKKKDVERIQQEYKNIETIYIGKGKHYIQEDHPHEIGKAIKSWSVKL
ncbi:MAG: haloalkane dehalogenase [Flavobacteriales bacterium]|nr:haloalkane dehalogenase [Flavobacteriales bacterium]